MKNKAEARIMKVLKALFLILNQKMNVKNEYSKNVYVTWQYFSKFCGTYLKYANKKEKQNRP